MNICKRPPYQKGQKRKSAARAREPNAEESRHWNRVAKLGCIVMGSTPCEGRITLHHCGTGGGGRKNHMQVIPLCWGHHLGAHGIDGKRISKREWQERYGSEEKLLARVQKMLRAGILVGYDIGAPNGDFSARVILKKGKLVEVTHA